MERLSLPYFYKLGAQINPLTKMTIEPSKRIDIFIAAYGTSAQIQSLFELFPTLTVCRSNGETLIKAVEKIRTWVNSSAGESKWSEKNFQTDLMFKEVIDKAKEFETVLSAELERLATYHVTQKGIYSTPDLIAQADLALPISVRNKIDEKVRNEIRESGKCLAYDNATASGFHILRAVEAVMHQYYLVVCKPNSQPEQLENWGAYIAELHQSKDPTVKETVAILQQIKDNDRNLIMHPELVLSPDDAFTLFEISKGAIMAMAKKLQDIKPDTSKKGTTQNT